MIEEVEPAAWDAMLADVGVRDAYYARAYVESAAILDPGEARLLRAGDAVFVAIEREIPGGDGLRDVTTPYGYGGPLGSAAFYDAYDAWCRERGVVTTFLRFHPLYGNHADAPDGTTERLADTATWPLDPNADLAAGMHQMHRRGARKAEREGVRVANEVAPETLDDFAALYDAVMARHDAESFYLFPPAYWDALLGLGERLVRFDARLDGELVASLLLLATPPWLHYHLGATSERGYDLGASKLLFREAARFGQAAGYEELHLGSGLGGSEDSLWQFKQRLAPAAPGREFRIGKLVHDPDAYRRLAGTDTTSGFFPAYRAQAAVGA